MANVTERRNKYGQITSYQIRVFRGRDSSGKRLKDYCMTWKPAPGMTKRQIEKELDRQAVIFEENCKQGLVSVDKPTFEKYAAYVVDLKEMSGCKPKTISSYKSLLARINTEIGPLKLQDIRPEHLNRFYAKLAEPGQNMHTGGGLSPKSILEHHRVISLVFSQAVKEGLVQVNTASRATPPKVPKHEMETLEAEDIQAILVALGSEPMKWQACIQLLIATGARRGEIAGLRWENVDFAENRLYLCENRVYVPGQGTISTSLKTGESRYVTISPSVMGLLRRWKKEQTNNFYKRSIIPSGYVLTAEDGGPIFPDSITDFLEKFSKRHDLPQLHPHLFRHTHASLLIAQGVDILAVSKRLGHSRTSTTLDTYSHALKKSDAAAAEAFDELIYQKKAN